MHIGLTYDLQTDPTDERQAEFDSPATIAALERALQALGHRVRRLGGAGELLADPARLQQVELVFNIAEGRHGRCREAWVPMLLEQWGVPFVGSGPSAQALGLDKLMSKRLAQASGVATPAFCVVDHPAKCAQAAALGFPLIVKPRHEGSGVGIDPGAVVQGMTALERRVEWLLARLRQPCLVERFIPFGEVTVWLIGNDPSTRPAKRGSLGIGPSERSESRDDPQLVAYPAIQRPLDPVSRLSCHVAGTSPGAGWLCPVELTAELDAEAARVALAMFRALRCRDLARVDLRVDERGRLYFLEINPLPSFDPAGSLGLLAEYLGVSYAQLVGQVLAAALRRLELPMRSADLSCVSP